MSTTRSGDQLRGQVADLLRAGGCKVAAEILEDRKRKDALFESTSFGKRRRFALEAKNWIKSLRTALFLSAFALGSAASAQNRPADVTVMSVLNMVKELAETEPAAGVRFLLRQRVGWAIRATGREAGFRSYLDERSSDSTRLHRNSAAWQKNRELEAEGKRLFLSGDEEGARQKLGECQWVPHQDIFCYRGELLLQIKLLSWESEAHDLPAALRRFRTNDWGPLEPAWARNVAQAYILAGRQSEIADVLSEVDGRVRVAAAEGRLGAGATLRNLASSGAPMIAIESALVVGRTVEERVVALAIVAEGLAGLPGLPDEDLR